MMTIGKLLKVADAETRRMNRQVYFEDGYFVLKIRYEYLIAEERIPDEAALLEWVRHISDKLWVQRRHIRAFIDCVRRVKGWERRVTGERAQRASREGGQT